MKSSIRVAVMAALFLSLGSTLALAGGPIEKACNRSDRSGATSSMCSCIQQAADQTLSNSDQRRAAKFFEDPEKAQDVRLSTSSADDAFWDRYRNFTDTASAYCAG